MQTERALNVIPFTTSTKKRSGHSTQKPRPTTRSKATSSVRSTPSLERKLPLIALCEEPMRSRVLRRAVARLEALDTEQIQIAEIVIAALCRGRL